VSEEHEPVFYWSDSEPASEGYKRTIKQGGFWAQKQVSKTETQEILWSQWFIRATQVSYWASLTDTSRE